MGKTSRQLNFMEKSDQPRYSIMRDRHLKIEFALPYGQKAKK